MDSFSFRANLRVDPMSRCAALSLPKDAIAILPFYQTQAELEIMEQDQTQVARCVLYPFTVRVMLNVFPEMYHIPLVSSSIYPEMSMKTSEMSSTSCFCLASIVRLWLFFSRRSKHGLGKFLTLIQYLC